MRVISRLNVGGPAIQAITLARRLEPLGYRTELVRGQEGQREGTMDQLASQLDVSPRRIDWLRRDPGPHDLRALIALVRLLRAAKPALVHTHAAKAGTLGRTAALLARPWRRPALVHTFHGHSLSGYFHPLLARVYVAIERFLARRTDRLIAVSEEVRDELVALGVAPRERFAVIPLGFDLSRFLVEPSEAARLREALRAELGVPLEVPLLTLIARLVPIKRVDRFLRIACLVAARDRHVRFLIVGDGELWHRLRASEEARLLGERLFWAGLRHDIPSVCLASDVVALMSDNEGTPVSLIEAQAAAVPVLGTDVGGVRSVVLDGRTGRVMAPDREPEIADAALELLTEPALARRLGDAGRRHVLERFSIERLVGDLDRLYRELLADSLAP